MLPLAERARLSALHSYEVLDTPPEPELDALAAAAARVCGTPVGLVSLVDRRRQFFKAHIGVSLVETAREGSFCSHAIQQQKPLVVVDAMLDSRFSRHPLVLSAPHIRFYAGAPLITSGGAAIGTLCVLDWVPRTLDEHQVDLLQVLAAPVVAALERRKMDLTRARVRETLEEELRNRLTDLSHAGADVHDDRGLAIFAGAESALQVVDDCVDALAPASEVSLQRRPVDLAQLGQSLVAVLEDSGQGRPIFTAAGDCRGTWDPDRLAQALSAILEDVMAAGPGVRIEARGDEATVSLYLQRPRLARRSVLLALRLDLARTLIEAHGGSIDERPSTSGLTLVVSLPREPSARRQEPSLDAER